MSSLFCRFSGCHAVRGKARSAGKGSPLAKGRRAPRSGRSAPCAWGAPTLKQLKYLIGILRSVRVGRASGLAWPRPPSHPPLRARGARQPIHALIESLIEKAGTKSHMFLNPDIHASPV